MVTEFTPLTSTLGGIMIGMSAVFLMLLMGRVMGATGVLSGIVVPTSKEDFSRRLALLFGMMTGPLVAMQFTGSLPTIQVPGSTTMLVLGGAVVGIGVTFGGGCTSGHGVCGMARLSPRSIVATIAFMIATAITVFIRRHVMGAY